MTEPIDIAQLEYVSKLSSFRGIDDAREEIKAAEESLRLAIERLKEAVRLAIEQASDSARQDLASYLYWQCEDIKPGWIAAGLGITPGKIRYIVVPVYSDQSCERCGKPLIQPSRSGYQFQGTMHDECQRAYWREQRAEGEARRNKTTIQFELRKLELKDMPYQEYLQTPEWQEKRKRALKKSDYRCQVCNTNSEQLNVHHRTYERRGDEIDSDLIVLCRSCHEKFHEIDKD